MNTMSNEELLREVAQRMSVHEKTISEQKETLVQLRELNKKLEMSEAMKSHFISNIKNEINNPLASILAVVQNILRRSADLPPDVVNSVRMISNEANALDFQLDNIMTAAEIESGHAVPQLVDTDLTQLVRRVVHSLANTIIRKGIKIALSSETQINFVTDPHYFKIIIANLLSNAVKFSRETSNVTILMNVSDQLNVSISDSGTGIEPHNLDRIFDRFFQLDTGVKKKFQGHGLGLSVCKDLVEILGGNISVETSGKGSIFTIRLPLQTGREGFSTALGDGDEVLFDQSF